MPVYNKREILLLPKVIVLNPKDGYDSEEMYQKIMKQTLFSKGCSGNCYYRESVAHR